MNKSEIKKLRRQFTKRFFAGNKLTFAAVCIVLLLAGVGELAIAWLIQIIIDTATGTSTALSLLDLVFAVVGLTAFMGILYTLLRAWQPRFIRKAMRQYKSYAFERIIGKSINSFTSENTATYISGLTNDIIAIETNYISKLFSLLQLSVSFFGALTLMLIYSPLLTLVAIGLSILPIIVSLLTGNQLAKRETEVSDRNESFVGTIKDMLTGFSVVKSFKAEKEATELFSQSNDSLENAKYRSRRTQLLIELLGTGSALVSQFGVFLTGAYLVLEGTGMTVGIIMLFVQLMNYILNPIAQIPQILANRKAANALIDKLAEAVESNAQNEGMDVDGTLDDAIELKNLSFSYEEGTPILNDISMRFEAGKSYAVVGGSGSGKSTLLNLLMGSYHSYEGDILYDGDELRQISSRSLYDLVSIVQQNVFVFNSTVIDNITMFRDFEQEQIERAVAMSGLSELIEKRGIDYECGENGNGLSGGERQRISIARCLLRNTPVMLVDEATAALDAETAFAVTSSILDISGLTRIIVTHRLEAPLLEKYDEILVLRNGRIEELGSFSDLMDRKGYFYSLYTVSQ